MKTDKRVRFSSSLFNYLKWRVGSGFVDDEDNSTERSDTVL